MVSCLNGVSSVPFPCSGKKEDLPGKSRHPRIPPGRKAPHAWEPPPPRGSRRSCRAGRGAAFLGAWPLLPPRGCCMRRARGFKTLPSGHLGSTCWPFRPHQNQWLLSCISRNSCCFLYRTTPDLSTPPGYIECCTEEQKLWIFDLKVNQLSAI